MRSSLFYRLHFSLDVRTKSSEGLLLHISGKYGVPLVILYLHKGKVKLSVGADEVISSQKINDGDWHNVCGKMLKCCVSITVFPKSQVLIYVVRTDQVQHEATQLLSSGGWYSNTRWTSVERIHT